jgi:hypothetical protein
MEEFNMKEKDTSDKVQYDLRFVQLTEGLKDLLLKEFQSENIPAECHKVKNKEVYTLWISLDKTVEIEAISRVILKSKVDEKQYGIWASLTSYYDNGGVRLPDNVAKLHREIGGYVDFSYIIIFE